MAKRTRRTELKGVQRKGDVGRLSEANARWLNWFSSSMFILSSEPDPFPLCGDRVTNPAGSLDLINKRGERLFPFPYARLTVARMIRPLA